MKAARLTAHDRQSIITTLVQRAIKKERSGQEATRTGLAMQAYEEMYPDADRQQMASLPDGWLPEKTSIDVIAQDRSVQIQLQCVTPQRFACRDVPFYASSAYHKSPSKKLVRGIEKLRQEEFETSKKEHRLEDQIRATLAPLTTWKKLFEVWPETQEVLKHLEPRAADFLPVVVASRLNKDLGLDQVDDTADLAQAA